MRKRAGRRLPILFIMPSAVWVAAVFLVPVVLTIVSAFTPARRSGELPVLGAASDTAVRTSTIKTAAFAVATVSVQMALGTGIGLALGMLRRFRIAATALIAIPLFMPPIVVGLQWRWLLDTSRPGSLFSSSFEALSNPTLALPLLGVISCWQWTPFVALVIATTMARLPSTMLTTATLDGLSLGAMLNVVIWPHIRAAFYWTLAWRLLDTVRTFDLIYVVTQGGPGSSTELLSFLVFQRAFVFLDRTQAGGAAAVLLAMSLVLLVAVTRAALGRGDASQTP